MKWFTSLRQSFRRGVALVRHWFAARLERHPRVRYECVQEFPDNLKPFMLYVVGEELQLWAAAMLCPCGCGDVIAMNLLEQTSPRWSVRIDPGGSVSVIPSVWRSKGCRSHFWLWESRIEWCQLPLTKSSYSLPFE